MYERGEIMNKYSIFGIFRAFPVTLIIFGTLLCIPAHAAGGAYSWYCVHRKDHLRPEIGSDISWVREYDGYYLDPECSNEKTPRDMVLYLTFDVGYENGNVAKILDVLKSEDVPAAFFVLSHVIEKETALVQRMFDEGHLVCNHTAHHKDMSKITEEGEFKRELESLEVLCLEKTGHSMAKLYRPPEGRFNRENLVCAKKMGFRTIFWSFAYADWDNTKQAAPEMAFKKIMDNVHNGAILLLHPTSATNAAILKDVIRECRARGYRFESLDALPA